MATFPEGIVQMRKARILIAAGAHCQTKNGDNAQIYIAFSARLGMSLAADSAMSIKQSLLTDSIMRNNPLLGC